MLTWPRGTYDHLRNQRLFQKHVKVTYDPVSIVINNVSISIIISNQKRCRSRESDHLELTNQEAQPVSTPHTGGGASALHAAPVFIQLIDSVKQSFTLLIFKSISETVRTAAVSSSPLSLSLSPPPPSPSPSHSLLFLPLVWIILIFLISVFKLSHHLPTSSSYILSAERCGFIFRPPYPVCYAHCSQN